MNTVLTNLIVLVILGLLAIVAVLWVYGNMVRANTACDEALARLNAELRKRYDLISRLIKTMLASPGEHESQVRKVVLMLDRAVANDGSAYARSRDERAMTEAARTLLAALAASPRDDKTMAGVNQLTQELHKAEQSLLTAMRGYNEIVKQINRRATNFPTNTVAKTFDLGSRQTFDLDAITPGLS